MSFEQDLNIECDLIYSEYLQNLLAKHIICKTIKENEVKLDDQLSIQSKIWEQGQQQLSTINAQFKEVELQLTIQQLHAKLKQSIFEINTMLQNFNVENNLVNYKAYLENECNKIYLKNVKPLKTQEDFDKFSILLHKFFKSMEIFNAKVVGNADTIKALNVQLQKIQLSLKDLKNKFIIAADLQTNVNLLVYKKLSGQLAYE